MTSSTPALATRTADESVLQAVLLDLDGTLVDTEGFWWETEVEVFAELGHTLVEEHRQVVVGGPMSRSAAYLIEVTGADITVPELSEELKARFTARVRGGVPLMPGVRRLLTELVSHQVPAAVVSASHRSTIDHMMRSLGPEHFALSVAGDEVRQTKPHPEPYLTAAHRLGVDPTRCAVIEDTATGVTSAEAAGCAVVAVPSVTPIEAAAGRRVVDSLEQIDLGFLQAMMDARHEPRRP